MILMELCFLKILVILGNKGYYARTNEEKVALDSLLNEEFVSLKKGRKSVYVVTEEGIDYLERLLHGRDDVVGENEFKKAIISSYKVHSSVMKPIVRIPIIRQDVVNDLRVSNEYFDRQLLELHNHGDLTLQTAISNDYGDGGISSMNRVYFYVTVEEAT